MLNKMREVAHYEKEQNRAEGSSEIKGKQKVQGVRTMRQSETQDEAFVFNPYAAVYVPQKTKQEQPSQPQQSHRVCHSTINISAADGSNERTPLEAHLQTTPPLLQITAPRTAARENKEVEAESNNEQAESSQRLAPQTAAKKETKDKKEKKIIIEEEETQYCSENDGKEEERGQGGNKYKKTRRASTL